MFTTLRDVFKEDPKEFITTMLFGISLFFMMWFLLWFQGTFMYDM